MANPKFPKVLPQMNLQRFRALVVQLHETQNTSNMVHLLTPGYGPLALWVKGLRRKGSEYRQSSLQPLNFIEVTAALHGDSDVATLRDVELLVPWEPRRLESNLPQLLPLALGSLAVELLHKTTENGQPIEEEFAALLQMLECIQTGDFVEEPYRLLTLWLGMLQLLGYLPLISPEVLRPWPAELPKPTHFLLQSESAMVALPPAGRESDEFHWPNLPIGSGEFLPLPPRGVRALYNAEKGEPLPSGVTLGETLQMINALSRFLEYTLDLRFASRDFLESCFQ
jgi:recombinational DNA repair protein (RecF pathway)